MNFNMLSEILPMSQKRKKIKELFDVKNDFHD